MRESPAKAKSNCREKIPAVFLRSCFILLMAISLTSSTLPKNRTETKTLTVRMESPEGDVLQVVQEVTQDQIIHGTYSYEKERILYGAHSANSARVFGTWTGPGKAFYKVADKVLSPRFFKDSEDIGTISVRYVVQDAGSGATTVLIDAVFVDARNVIHPSTGDVESSEYAAIQAHLKNLQASRTEAKHVAVEMPSERPPTGTQPVTGTLPAGPSGNSSAPDLSVQELQTRVAALRHQVELRVKDSGASLKSAPFHSSATIQSLPAETEVLIVVLTPYWYGVETADGHHGWVHHSQLESLP